MTKPCCWHCSFDGSGRADASISLPGVAPFHRVGDVAGVGIFTAGDGTHELVFTVNGNKVYSRKLAASAEIVAQMHLAIGLLGSGVSVDINGGEHPFRYIAANTAPGGELPFGIKPAPKGTARGVVGAGAGGPSADLMRRIQQLPSNSTVRRRCTSHKIDVMSVAWEDTGRTKGSCFGPNISDMTLAVGGSNMPIFRKPNYSDLTSDQDMDNFWLVVGNEATGAPKRSIQLSEYLTDVGRYIGRPEQGGLLAPSRDSKVLTAAQACVLPLRDGKVEFNVRLYNYQSRSEPAVLVIVASSEGTSAQVVLGRDNLLRFNKAGGAADFVAERLSDDRAKRGVAIEGEMSADERKRNCLLIIQVPLKVERPSRPGFFKMAEACAVSAPTSSVRYRSSTVSKSVAAPARGIEAAMISTSDARGVYEGVRGHKLVRDTDFPIRCTLQYYHVTDTTDLSEDVVAGIAGQVNELYDAAAPWNKGSLVTRGGSGRVTEHSSALGFAGSIAPPPPPVVWVWGFRV